MSRLQKIRKLSNAIKEYRGTYHKLPNGEIKWTQAPRIHKAHDIERHLRILKIEPTKEVIDKINNFKTRDEFDFFIASL
jgi:hypothetical protein